MMGVGTIGILALLGMWALLGLLVFIVYRTPKK